MAVQRTKSGPLVSAQVIFNISVCSRRQQNVRYGPKTDQIDASQRTGASCQKATYVAQKIPLYSITSSTCASKIGESDSPSACAVLLLTVT